TIRIIENPVRKGIGYAIKKGYTSALSEGADIIVVMAGNGKDDPQEIPRLTSPIIRDGYDNIGSLGQRRGVPLLDRVSKALPDRVFDDSNRNRSLFPTRLYLRKYGGIRIIDN